MQFLYDIVCDTVIAITDVENIHYVVFVNGCFDERFLEIIHGVRLAKNIIGFVPTRIF